MLKYGLLLVLLAAVGLCAIPARTPQDGQSCDVSENVVGTLLIQKRRAMVGMSEVKIQEDPLLTPDVNSSGETAPEPDQKEPSDPPEIWRELADGVDWNYTTKKQLKDAGFVGPAQTDCFQWNKDYGNKEKGACDSARVLALHCSADCVLSVTAEQLFDKETIVREIAHNSAFECQQACQHFKNCDFFTFDTNDGLNKSACWLRSAIQCNLTFASSPGFVSGPAACPVRSRLQLVSVPSARSMPRADREVDHDRDPQVSAKITRRPVSASTSKASSKITNGSHKESGASSKIVPKMDSSSTRISRKVTTSHGEGKQMPKSNHAHLSPKAKPASTNHGAITKSNSSSSKVRNASATEVVQNVTEVSSPVTTPRSSDSTSFEKVFDRWLMWLWSYFSGWAVLLFSCLVVCMYSHDAEKRDLAMESQMAADGDQRPPNRWSRHPGPGH